MPLLYYWRPDNYHRDLDYGASYHLNQASQRLHKIEIGDSLWAFTRNSNDFYVLAAELIIKAKTINRPRYRYGKYRVWGDPKKSRYFETESQSSVEAIIRNLTLAIDTEHLGKAFQGRAAIRQITVEDHLLLKNVAANLKNEERARLLPEEELEAKVFLGDEKKVREWLYNVPSGLIENRMKYLYGEVTRRNSEKVKQLRELYNGSCQICEWSPRQIYDAELCQAHHIQWLSQGGTDDLANMILVCPNHHQAIHKLDAVLDYQKLTFHFRSQTEEVKLDRHLRLAK